MNTHECESCAQNGTHGVPAVRQSNNPEWSGYWLCEECAEHYDAEAPVCAAPTESRG